MSVLLQGKKSAGCSLRHWSRPCLCSSKCALTRSAWPCTASPTCPQVSSTAPGTMLQTTNIRGYRMFSFLSVLPFSVMLPEGSLPFIYTECLKHNWSEWTTGYYVYPHRFIMLMHSKCVFQIAFDQHTESLWSWTLNLLCFCSFSKSEYRWEWIYLKFCDLFREKQHHSYCQHYTH